MQGAYECLDLIPDVGVAVAIEEEEEEKGDGADDDDNDDDDPVDVVEVIATLVLRYATQKGLLRSFSLTARETLGNTPSKTWRRWRYRETPFFSTWLHSANAIIRRLCSTDSIVILRMHTLTCLQ